jgi:hypothetical protein
VWLCFKIVYLVAVINTAWSTVSIEFCTGKNFRILLCPRTIWPDPARARSLSTNMLPVPHLSPTFFYSSPNEARSIYNLPWLSYHEYIFLLIQRQYSLSELFIDVLKTSQVILAFGERYKDIGWQVCKVLSRIISGRGQLRKSPRKSSRWDLFPEPDCVTSIR